MAKTKTKTKIAKKTTKTTTKTKFDRSKLATSGNKTTKATKSSTPVVAVTNQDHVDAINALVTAKNKAKAAKSAVEVAEHNLRDEATDYFETRCREDGTLHSSIRLTGDGGASSIMYTQVKKCRGMKEADTVDPLRATFGTDFDGLFAFERSIEIDTERLSDEQFENVMVALQKTLGDEYDDIVTPNCMIKPRDAYYGRRILDDRIRKLSQRANEEGLAVPNMASFKL